MLKQEIKNNWKTDIIGYAQSIISLEKSGFPAWTIRFPESYGVAIPYEGEDINESFARAKIRSAYISLNSGDTIPVLLLSTDSTDIEAPFAVLCEALIDPGENGTQRCIITSSPILWWKDWKELLGNKNIDDRIYDTLGELCVLRKTVDTGEEPEWTGPDGGSYDIETDSHYIEVKSTINRSKTEVTISNQFQLFPPGKPLKLIFCRFEPVIVGGTSIDSLLESFENIGYNTTLLNSKLESKGFEKGMSSRKRRFILHEMLQYEINDSFPRITPESFIGGIMPVGITKITYTVDLSGMASLSLLRGEEHDIQND